MYKKNWIKSAFKQKYNSKLWFKKKSKNETNILWTYYITYFNNGSLQYTTKCHYNVEILEYTSAKFIKFYLIGLGNIINKKIFDLLKHHNKTRNHIQHSNINKGHFNCVDNLIFHLLIWII